MCRLLGGWWETRICADSIRCKSTDKHTHAHMHGRAPQITRVRENMDRTGRQIGGLCPYMWGMGGGRGRHLLNPKCMHVMWGQGHLSQIWQSIEESCCCCQVGRPHFTPGCTLSGSAAGLCLLLQQTQSGYFLCLHTNFKKSKLDNVDILSTFKVNNK